MTVTNPARPDTAISNAAAISLDGVQATYSQAIVALSGVSLSVAPGEIVALLGANGAGKSTTLQAISNLLPAHRGRVTAGTIRLDGQDITHLPAHQIVRRGLVQVLEGRHCFRGLSIEENLLTGAAAIATNRAGTRSDLERVYGIFPALRDKRRLAAGLASGGEQQMTAVGRALMSRPRMLVLDEPSMGLAPRVVADLFATLRHLNAETGLTILVAEQNSTVALRIAHRAYVLEHGEVALSGDATLMRDRDELQALYLGRTLRCAAETASA